MKACSASAFSDSTPFTPAPNICIPDLAGDKDGYDARVCDAPFTTWRLAVAAATFVVLRMTSAVASGDPFAPRSWLMAGTAPWGVACLRARSTTSFPAQGGAPCDPRQPASASTTGATAALA